jgi:hypothetical protein
VPKDKERDGEDKGSFWDQVRSDLEEAGALFVEYQIRRVTRYARVQEAIDLLPLGFEDGRIRGILILRGATNLLDVAAKFKIHLNEDIRFPLNGVFLTRDKIRYMDQICWKGEMFKVRQVEKRRNGNLEFSFNIAYLSQANPENVR